MKKYIPQVIAVVLVLVAAVVSFVVWLSNEKAVAYQNGVRDTELNYQVAKEDYEQKEKVKRKTIQDQLDAMSKSNIELFKARRVETKEIIKYVPTENPNADAECFAVERVPTVRENLSRIGARRKRTVSGR